MEDIIKLIKEYGELENRVGFTSAINRGNITTEEMELRNKRNDKLTELMKATIKINERMLNHGE